MKIVKINIRGILSGIKEIIIDFKVFTNLIIRKKEIPYENVFNRNKSINDGFQQFKKSLKGKTT